MNTEAKIWTAISLAFILLAIGFAGQVFAQDVAYCKHGQTGEVIVIEANYACPSGYYRI